MKNIILLLSLFYALISSAQQSINTLEDIDGVNSVIINKEMLELLKKFPDVQSEDVELFNAIEGLNELKVFSTENTIASTKMDSVAVSLIKSNHLTQLMRVKEKGSKVKIYVKSTDKKDIVSEVLMLLDTKEPEAKKPTSTIIYLTGIIDVNKLSKITNNYKED